MFILCKHKRYRYVTSFIRDTNTDSKVPHIFSRVYILLVQPCNRATIKLDRAFWYNYINKSVIVGNERSCYTFHKIYQNY